MKESLHDHITRARRVYRAQAAAVDGLIDAVRPGFVDRVMAARRQSSPAWLDLIGGCAPVGLIAAAMLAGCLSWLPASPVKEVPLAEVALPWLEMPGSKLDPWDFR